MKTVTIAVLGLLLTTPAAFAEQVTINWNGDITNYAATSDSSAPQTLTNEDLRGKIIFDTSLLPTADAGSPPGVLSYSGTDLFQSSFRWQGGVFKIGSSVDQILFNSTSDELQLTAQDVFTNRKGDTYTKLFTFDVSGLGTSSVSGSGYFFNVSDTGSGYGGQYNIDKAHVKATAAPEIDPGSGLTALSFLAGCLAVIRGRRRVV